MVALVAALPANAAQETQLRAVRGVVGYQLAPTAPFSRVYGTLLLPDDRIAITRAASNGLLVLTDSSEVALGDSTSVAVGAVTQAAAAAPNAIGLTIGTIRFDVRHPKGGQSNYIFTTATSQIAVRGTIGIVATGPDGDTITCLDCAPGDVTVKTKRRALALLTGQTALVSISGEITVSATTAAITSSFAAVGLNSVARATTPFIPGIDRASETLGSTTPLVVGGAVAATVIGIEAANASQPSGPAAATPTPAAIIIPVVPTASPSPTPTRSPTPTPAPSPTGALTINAKARTPQAAPATAAPAPPPLSGPGGRAALPGSRP